MVTFVDTGVWYASVVPTDPRHTDVISWLRANNASLLTSDYIVDETLTLLRARGERTRALLLGEGFFNARLAEIYTLDETDVALAWEVFKRFDDKDWSFTDCASKAVIERLGIQQAFAFDHHFEQFGTVRVVP